MPPTWPTKAASVGQAYAYGWTEEALRTLHYQYYVFCPCPRVRRVARLSHHLEDSMMRRRRRRRLILGRGAIRTRRLCHHRGKAAGPAAATNSRQLELGTWEKQTQTVWVWVWVWVGKLSSQPTT